MLMQGQTTIYVCPQYIPPTYECIYVYEESTHVCAGACAYLSHCQCFVMSGQTNTTTATTHMALINFWPRAWGSTNWNELGKQTDGMGAANWRLETGHGDMCIYRTWMETPSAGVHRTLLACAALWPQVNSLTKCQAYLFIYFSFQAAKTTPAPELPIPPSCLYARPRPTFSSRFASLAKCLFNLPHRVYEKTQWSTNNQVLVGGKGAVVAP